MINDDDVRRIVAAKEGSGSWGGTLIADWERTLIDVAKAWLRSREQQPDAGVPARDIDQDRLVAALAHRVCCGLEHDPANGKLHGDCVVCGVPWPCDTAKAFLVPAEDVRESLSDIIASVPTPTNALPMETELVDAPVPDGGRDGCHVLSDEERDRLFMMLDPDVQAHDEQEPLDTHGRIYRAGLERGRADVQARFQTVELDDVAHRALRQAAQDVLDEAPTIQTPDVQAHRFEVEPGAQACKHCSEEASAHPEIVEAAGRLAWEHEMEARGKVTRNECSTTDANDPRVAALQDNLQRLIDKTKALQQSRVQAQIDAAVEERLRPLREIVASMYHDSESPHECRTCWLRTELGMEKS